MSDLDLNLRGFNVLADLLRGTVMEGVAQLGCTMAELGRLGVTEESLDLFDRMEAEEFGLRLVLSLYGQFLVQDTLPLMIGDGEHIDNLVTEVTWVMSLVPESGEPWELDDLRTLYKGLGGLKRLYGTAT